MSASEHRPSTVTHACLLAGTGAVLTLFTIFGMLSDWGSQEVREQVEQALESSPISTLDTEQVLEVARLLLMGIAAFAVAAVVLSIYTARGDRVARIVLTVLAGGWLPVALVFGVVGLLFAAMGAASLVLLWRPESRQWFARGSSSPAQAPVRDSGDMSMPPQPGEQPSQDAWRQQPQSEQPPRTGHGGYPVLGDQPFGTPPQGQSAPPQAQWAPPQGPPGGRPPGPWGPPPPLPFAPVPERRPAGVTAAAVVTLIAASIALLGAGAVGLFFLLDRRSFADEVGSAFAMSGDELSTVTTVLGWLFVIIAVLAAVAVVLAILLLRDRHRVRVPLVVLSGVTIPLGILTIPVGLLWVVAAIVVIVLLFAGDAGVWFDLRNHRTDRERASYPQPTDNSGERR